MVSGDAAAAPDPAYLTALYTCPQCVSHDRTGTWATTSLGIHLLLWLLLADSPFGNWLGTVLERRKGSCHSLSPPSPSASQRCLIDRHFPLALVPLHQAHSALSPMHLDFCSSLPLGEAEEYNGSEHGHWVREIGLASRLCHLLSVLLNFSEPQFLWL